MARGGRLLQRPITGGGADLCYDAASGNCDFSASGYRLPTEAEWEDACRGGTTQAYYFGDDPRGVSTHAWFKDNADRTTHPVGQWPANPFGLFDMSGNVWQWCNDWYRVDYYANSPADNPRGPEQGEKKVLRGGGFKNKAEECTSCLRGIATSLALPTRASRPTMAASAA